MDLNKFAYISGFLKTAAAAGLNEPQARAFYKQANGEDGGPEMEAAMQQAGGGASLPPPPMPGEQPSAEGTDLQQLEMMLQQLSPEQLQQLMQEVQQMQAQGGGDPNAAPPQDPNAPPQDPSQDPNAGMVDPNQIAAKQAEYAEGFVIRGMEHGYSQEDAITLYKQAAAQFTPPEFTKEASEKEAAYFEGFASRAYELGYDEQQTVALYKAMQ